MSARWHLLCAAIVAIVASVATMGCGKMQERFQPLAIGDVVPAYAVRTMASDTARVGARGPVTLVNVWATWCIPCRPEFPELERISREYGPQGLRVLAVSIDQGNDADVQRFVREHGASFTIGRDPESRIRDAYQTIGVPETYLVSKDGRLLWKHLGALPPNGAGVRAAIEKALR